MKLFYTNSFVLYVCTHCLIYIKSVKLSTNSGEIGVGPLVPIKIRFIVEGFSFEEKTLRR